VDDAFASFDGHQFLLLTTFRRSGEGVPTPVWFARVGDTLGVFTSAQTGKVKRLRRDGRVRIAPCSFMGKPKGPEQGAAARLVDGDPWTRRRVVNPGRSAA
jgi:PPOX class probable F420-dependent enzyme